MQAEVVLKCEGYVMFLGEMEINVPSGCVVKYGTWLYRPDTECWYCDGVSYPWTICCKRRSVF